METKKVGNGKTVVIPSGITGKALARKRTIPQTSELAKKLNPELAAKAAEEATKETNSVLAKAKAAKADKASTPGKKTEKVAGKYANNITSMEKLGDWCLAEKFSPEEIEKVFIAGYALKGKTEMSFIKPRIAIYLNIARKRAAQVAAKADKKVEKASAK